MELEVTPVLESYHILPRKPDGRKEIQTNRSSIRINILIQGQHFSGDCLLYPEIDCPFDDRSCLERYS